MSKSGNEAKESWTVRPEADVASLMKKAINRLVRRAMRQGVKLERRGLRSRLLNEALRAQFGHLKGKREEARDEGEDGRLRVDGGDERDA